jgi:hypothetical protein
VSSDEQKSLGLSICRFFCFYAKVLLQAGYVLREGGVGGQDRRRGRRDKEDKGGETGKTKEEEGRV